MEKRNARDTFLDILIQGEGYFLKRKEFQPLTLAYVILGTLGVGYIVWKLVEQSS